MIFCINDVLSSEEIKIIIERLNNTDFVDGKTTAGWHAKLVKNNKQLSTKASYSQELSDLVKTALKRNSLFQSAVLPRLIHSILFSRYEPGMSYGTHVDNAFMGNQEFWRSDVSFTLFLNCPSTYQGGELVLECSDYERIYKLEAGSMIVYPSSMLHRVAPITEGIRLAVVGWVQSLIRDPNERELLFDLDTARRSTFAKQGKTIEFDLISKSYANLLRKWSD